MQIFFQSFHNQFIVSIKTKLTTEFQEFKSNDNKFNKKLSFLSGETRFLYSHLKFV
jgi:hypothetical protein